MGSVNEAIVSYNAALVRPGDSQGAQVGLARAFRAQGDTQSRHWLQVNNIHLEDDPVWTQA